MNLKALIRKAKQENGDAKSPAGAAGAPSPALAERLEEVASLALPPALTLVTAESAVGSLPTVCLLEEWLPPEAESQLLANFRARAHDFVQLRGKRTARYGGNPGPPFEPEPLPSWLAQLCEAVAATTSELDPGASCPNHVLVNHYRPGEGIMPHTDGPAYTPRAVIVSLGSAAVFDFWTDHAHAASGRPPALSLLVPPRSLLLFIGEAYSGHLHGIADRRYDDLGGAVANWSPEARAHRTASGGRPDWARRQLESAACPEEAELPASCGLRREERISLTIRHVPLPEPA
mmetsp:Transcript_67124/g.175997  ORF Transcript_67124/g.175997 Transcript_67124/m.175997 type:complete len:290 (+) Transcript_67124:70-939(+)